MKNLVRVLLADDDREVAGMVQKIFELYQQHQNQSELDFVFAETGQEAVEKVKTGPRFDLILMDYQIPPTNSGGVWAAEKIRAIDPTIPVVFLSAYTARYNLAMAEPTGAVAYIAKTIFTQMPVVGCLLAQDWEGLRRYADGEEVWVFSISNEQ